MKTTTSKKPTKKFWNTNEKRVLKKLGLESTPASGAGEVFKEDGRNEYVLCQLKSTVRDSVSVQRRDVETLMYNANLERKIPVFVIQFLDGQTLVATTADQLENIGKYLKGEEPSKPSDLSVKAITEIRKSPIKRNSTWNRTQVEAPKTIAEVNERRKK